MRYVEARARLRQREEAYRIYVTDGLYCLSQCVAKIANGGQVLSKQYRDLIDKKKDKAPQKSGDEIAMEVILKCGLKLKAGEEK